MKRIVLITFLATTLFAYDNSDFIWTWGNGDNIAAVLSFLYFLLNDDNLMGPAIKIAAIIGLLVVFFGEYRKMEKANSTVLALRFFIFFAVSYATIEFLLTVKQDESHRVYVLSANELSSASWSKCRPVNGDDDCYAPIGVKLIYSTLTNLERAGLLGMEKSMMDTNALTYSFTNMGYGFGFNYVDMFKKPSVSSYQYNTFMDYYENCLIFDLASGDKSVDEFYQSGDLSSFMASANSRLTTVYSKANPKGVVKACFEVASSDLLGNPLCTNSAKKIKASTSGSQASEASVYDICDAGEKFTQTLFNSTKSADETIKQQQAIYLTQEAFINSATTSGLSPSELAYGTTLSNREMAAKWSTIGMMAKEWLPSARGMMQGVAIGLIWVFALLSIATASPVLYLGSALAFQLTLMIWSFILALINYMSIERMTAALPNMFFSDGLSSDVLTLLSAGTIDDEIQKTMAFLGYMSIAAFGIAAGMVKVGGNILSSMGNGISQLAVGMGTSSDMARGHQNYGLTKSDASGTQSVNRRGDMEVIYPNSQSLTKEHNETADTERRVSSENGGGYNTITSHKGEDGQMSWAATDESGKQSLEMGYGGKVKSANLSGVSASMNDAVNHTTGEMKNKAASIEQSASTSVSNAVSSTSSSAQDMIKSVGKEQGTSAATDVANTYNEQVQNNLQKAYESGQLSEDAYQRLRKVDYSMGANVEASVSGGFTAFGNGVQTKGSANVGVNATASGQHNQSDKISLSEKDALALSNAMATGLAVTAKTSDGLSASAREGFTQSAHHSLDQTNQASSNYAEAKKLTETATKLESTMKTNGASITKDLMLEVADTVIRGDENLGIRGLGMQKGADTLFNDKQYLQNVTQKVIDSKIASLEAVKTDNTFTDVQKDINAQRGHIAPVDMSTPHTVDMNSAYSGYNTDVTNTGNKWQNNMPDVTNAPTIPTDGSLQKEIEKSHGNHSEENVFSVAAPTLDDLPPVKTGQGYNDPKMRRDYQKDEH